MTSVTLDCPSSSGAALAVHPGRMRAQLAAILRVPLLAKLLGANMLLLVAALISHAIAPSASMATQLWIVLGLSFGVTALLGWLALRPIADLQATAERVSAGDFSARVPTSKLADRNILRLSGTMNRLLDRVETDRARIHYLAGRSVRARDLEREHIARELRDSLAQMVSAAGMQLAAAQTVNTDPAVREQLEATMVVIHQLNEEMRSIAETLYPGTLGEFGMRNALDVLVRRTNRRSNLHIGLELGMFDVRLTSQSANALYRVADEALRNVVQHADARHARVLLHSNGAVCLQIEDDGRGIDMRMNDPVQAGLGLFSAKAVLALAGGELQITSAPGLGTRVVARVPLSGIKVQS